MNGLMKMAKLDFITMKSQFLAYLSLVGVIFLSWTMGLSLILLCVSASLYVALFSYTIFSLQEKNNLDRLYGSVSITVKDIVSGRYVFIFLNFLLALFATIILYFISTKLQNKVLQMDDVAISICLALLLFSVLTGVQIPMFFKMGYTKAKVWSSFPFIVAAILVILSKPLLYALSGVIRLSEIIEFALSNQSILIIACILASCVIQFFSYQIAVTAYRKRKRG